MKLFRPLGRHVQAVLIHSVRLPLIVQPQALEAGWQGHSLQALVEPVTKTQFVEATW